MTQPPAFFVHMGMPKTASTTVQAFFTQNRQRLLAQGIFYPERIAFSDAQCQLHRALHATLEPGSLACLENDYRNAGGQDVAGLLKEEVAQSGARKVIISSEELYAMRNPALLRDALAAKNVRILIFLRRQDDFLASMYNQVVKDRLLAASFDEFLAQLPLTHPHIALCRYDELLRKWAAVFGEENITPMVYHDYSLPHGLLETLGQIIGFDLADMAMPQEDTNPKLSSSLLIMKREVNRHLSGEQERIACGRLFQALNHDLTGERAASGDEIESSITKRNAILSSYADGNAWVNMHYFKGRSALFRPPSAGESLLPDAWKNVEITPSIRQDALTVAALIKEMVTNPH